MEFTNVYVPTLMSYKLVEFEHLTGVVNVTIDNTENKFIDNFVVVLKPTWKHIVEGGVDFYQNDAWDKKMHFHGSRLSSLTHYSLPFTLTCATIKLVDDRAILHCKYNHLSLKERDDCSQLELMTLQDQNKILKEKLDHANATIKGLRSGELFAHY